MRIVQFACSSMTVNALMNCLDMKNSKMTKFTVFGQLPYFCMIRERNEGVVDDLGSRSCAVTQ